MTDKRQRSGTRLKYLILSKSTTANNGYKTYAFVVVLKVCVFKFIQQRGTRM